MLNGVQFSIDTSDPDLYDVNAHHKGRHIGRMLFDPTDRYKVTNIWSDVPRRGVATGMWHYAKEQGYPVRHSDVQTPAGRAWAKSVGD